MGRHPDTVQYYFVAHAIPFRYQSAWGRIACCVSTAGIGGEGLDPERIVRAQRLGRSNCSRKAAGDVGHPLTPNLDQITLKSVTQNAIVRITIFGSFPVGSASSKHANRWAHSGPSNGQSAFLIYSPSCICSRSAGSSQQETEVITATAMTPNPSRAGR